MITINGQSVLIYRLHRLHIILGQSPQEKYFHLYLLYISTNPICCICFMYIERSLVLLHWKLLYVYIQCGYRYVGPEIDNDLYSMRSVYVYIHCGYHYVGSEIDNDMYSIRSVYVYIQCGYRYAGSEIANDMYSMRSVYYIHMFTLIFYPCTRAEEINFS